MHIQACAVTSAKIRGWALDKYSTVINNCLSHVQLLWSPSYLTWLTQFTMWRDWHSSLCGFASIFNDRRWSCNRYRMGVHALWFTSFQVLKTPSEGKRNSQTVRHWHAMLYFFMGICVYIVLHKDDIFLGHEFVNLVWCSLKCVHMNYNALVFPGNIW